MAMSLTCSGAITVDLDNKPVCAAGWVVEPLETDYMSQSEFSDLIPEILLLFVVAFGIRMVISMVSQNAARY